MLRTVARSNGLIEDVESRCGLIVGVLHAAGQRSDDRFANAAVDVERARAFASTRRERVGP